MADAEEFTFLRSGGGTEIEDFHQQLWDLCKEIDARVALAALTMLVGEMVDEVAGDDIQRHRKLFDGFVTVAKEMHEVGIEGIIEDKLTESGFNGAFTGRRH